MSGSQLRSCRRTAPGRWPATIRQAATSGAKSDLGRESPNSRPDQGRSRLMRRGCRRNSFANGADSHGLGRRADFQNQRRHREPTVRQQDVVPPLERPKPGELGANCIRSRYKSGEHVCAHFVRNGSPRLAVLFIGDGDIGVGEPLDPACRAQIGTSIRKSFAAAVVAPSSNTATSNGSHFIFPPKCLTLYRYSS